jgi:hypothetical protein
MPRTPHLRTLRQPLVAFARLFELPLELDYDACHRVLQELFAHHDVLRLTMERTGDGRVFAIPPPHTPPALDHIDVTREFLSLGEEAFELRLAEIEQAFSLGSVFARFAYLSTTDRQPPRLAVVLDHIVFDAYAIEVLQDDIRRAIGQIARGLPIDFGFRSISYHEFWSRIENDVNSDSSSADRAYWRDVRWDDVCTLPRDDPRGHDSFSWIWDPERGKIVPYWDRHFRSLVTVSLDEATSRRLLAANSPKRGLIVEHVLCGLLLSMQEYSGVRDKPFSITLITNKRIGVFDDVDTSRTMGNFGCRCHAMFDCRNVLDRAGMFNLVRAQMAELPREGKTQDVLMDFDASVSGYVLSGVALNYFGRTSAHAFDGSHGDSAGKSDSDADVRGMVRWPEYVLEGMEPSRGYLVRLHFVEPVFDAAGRRFFDVWLNGRLAIAKLDIIRESGAKFKAVTRELRCESDESGRIAVNLVSYSTSDGKAIISGVEILAPLAAGAFDIPYDHASFRPIRKINAGGPTASDFLSDDRQIGGEPISWSNPVDISGIRSPAPISVYASACGCPEIYYRPHFPPITFQCGFVEDTLRFNILFATNLYRRESIQRLGGLLIDNLRHMED